MDITKPDLPASRCNVWALTECFRWPTDHTSSGLPLPWCICVPIDNILKWEIFIALINEQKYYWIEIDVFSDSMGVFWVRSVVWQTSVAASTRNEDFNICDCLCPFICYRQSCSMPDAVHSIALREFPTLELVLSFKCITAIYNIHLFGEIGNFFQPNDVVELKTLCQWAIYHCKVGRTQVCRRSRSCKCVYMWNWTGWVNGCMHATLVKEFKWQILEFKSRIQHFLTRRRRAPLIHTFYMIHKAQVLVPTNINNGFMCPCSPFAVLSSCRLFLVRLSVCATSTGIVVR